MALEGENVKEIRLGPGALFIGEVGTPEPVNLTDAIDSGWSGLGYTEEGSSWNVDISSSDVEVAEEKEPVLTNVDSRTVTVSFALAQVTANNLELALNGGTIVSSDVTRSVGAGTVVAATGVITASAHGLVVGDRVKVGTTNGSMVAGTRYYVLTVPSSSTFTIGATPGGSTILANSDGTVGTVVEVTDRIVTFEPPVEANDVTRKALLWVSDTEDEIWIARKALQTGSVEMARRKSPTKTTIPMSWKLEKVTGLAPFKAIFRDSEDL